jgi:hypothetical protein
MSLNTERGLKSRGIRSVFEQRQIDFLKIQRKRKRHGNEEKINGEKDR